MGKMLFKEEKTLGNFFIESTYEQVCRSQKLRQSIEIPGEIPCCTHS